MIIESRRAVRLEELSAALGVSQATIRRDLDQLAAEGHVRRVHGGVVAVDERPPEPHFDVKAAEASEAKERIAARALALVGPLSRFLLETLHVDRALIGSYAVSLEDGLTTTDPAEAYTKELVLGRAGQVILLESTPRCVGV